MIQIKQKKIMKKFEVTILSELVGFETTYWFHREQAVDYLNKCSDIDASFISGIVWAKSGRCCEAVYVKVK